MEKHMCLAVPAKIESLDGQTACCRVGQSETFVNASTMLLEREPVIGDYVIVHAGFALRILDLQEAEESLRYFLEIGLGGPESA